MHVFWFHLVNLNILETILIVFCVERRQWKLRRRTMILLRYVSVKIVLR